MSLDRVKTTVLEEAKAKAAITLDTASKTAERILADGRATDERIAADVIRDTKARLEKDTNRELERLQHDNRLQILSAKNKAIDEVFKRVSARLSGMNDGEYIAMIGKWLDALPADVGGVLRVNPRDEAKFKAGLDTLNRNRGGNGRFTQIMTDAKVPSGAVVDGPDYNIDCTIDRRLGELRETSAGDLARVLFGA